MTDKKPIRQEQTNIAVLIDGDNMSADKLGDIISFVSIYGNPIVRRIYCRLDKACDDAVERGSESVFFPLGGSTFLCRSKEYDGYDAGYRCDGFVAWKNR